MSVDRRQPGADIGAVCPNPIFIIGSPRSGTTALANALGAHPDLFVSKESYFIHQLCGNGRIGHVWRQNWERGTPSWLRAEGVERSEFLEHVGVGINALFTSRSGGRRWVDQTPLYTLMADDLADMFPGASFLHIVRDGRAVVRSMGRFHEVVDELRRPTLAGEVPAWTNDFRLACATWADWVGSALDFARSRRDRCLTCSNEELASDPAAGFERIFSFLGLTPHPEPEATFRGPRVNSSFRRGTRPRDGDWDTWEPELRAEFAEIAGPTLVRAGYATEIELARWSGTDREVARR